jgi:uncharacterized protein (TIGR03083 family)
MSTHRQTLDALFATWDSIDEVCAALTEEQWKRATDCPGWSVQDTLSHLIGVERLLHGLPATEHRAEGGEHVRNPIGEFNEHEVDVRRSRPGSEVFAEWIELTAERRDTLDAADDDYFAREMMTPTGPGTMADFLHIRVLDCYVHEQDVRRAVGNPGHLDGPAAELTIDRLTRTLPIVVGKRAKTPEGGAVRFEITGPVVRTLTYRVVEGRARLDEAGGAADCTVSMDSPTFLALATGRIGATDATWRASGDDALAERVASNLNMMI